MDNVVIEKLDAQELFHLGIKASEVGDHDKAIVFLKESVTKKYDAKVQYILAAEYAEIGMIDRAIDGMEQAIAADETLTTARLQLGLLYSLKNDTLAALSAWEPLKTLPNTDPLYLFATGLSQLLNNNIAEATQIIEKGIKENKNNPSLNNNMNQILAHISSIANNQQDADQIASTSAAKRLFLNAYNNDRNIDE